MNITNYSKALNFWKNVPTFWGEVKEKEAITAIWEAYYNRREEMSSSVAISTTYGVNALSASKNLSWEKYTIIGTGTRYITGLPDRCIDVPELHTKIRRGTIYTSINDYEINYDTLVITGTIPNGIYWSPITKIENDNMEKFFNNGFLDLNLDNFTSEESKHLMRLIWSAFRQGGTSLGLLSIVNALFGLPFRKYPGVVGASSSKYFSGNVIKSKIYSSKTDIFLYSSKTNVDINVSDNVITIGSLYNKVIINDLLYTIIHVDGSNRTLYPDVADGNYSVKLYELDSEIQNIDRESLVGVDMDSANVYSLTIPQEIGERNIYITSSNNVNEKGVMLLSSSYDKIPNFPESLSNNNMFHPIQYGYEIKGWLDYVDPITDDTPSYLKKEYEGEEDKVYKTTSTGVTDTLTFVTTTGLTEGDYIKASNAIVVEKEIISIEKKDSLWWIKTTNNYSYIGLQSVVVYKDNGSIHTGKDCIITNGQYDAVSGYYLLGTSTDLDIFIGADSFLGIKSITTSIRRIKEVSGSTLTLDSSIDTSNMVITKIPFGKYGSNMIKPITVDVVSGDSSVSVSNTNGLIEVNDTIMIVSDIEQATEYEITDSTNTTVTITPPAVMNYLKDDNASIIIFKKMKIHNGIIIKQTSTGDHAAQKSNYPNFVDNVEKVLTKILPAGSNFVWEE